jgi:Acetyltransferase (GNAT) domain
VITKGFSILTLENEPAWNEVWSQLPDVQRDVFARSSYYRASEMIVEGKAECAVLFSDRGSIVYPYFRRPIHTLEWIRSDEPCYDIEGAYGFGGPLGALEDRSLWVEFNKSMTDYCRQVGVVAEFVRLHPLRVPAALMAPYYEVKRINVNVVVDVRKNDAELIKSYKHNCRKNVKKAIRSGVRVFGEQVPISHWQEYSDIYDGTLERRNAMGCYRFPPEFYEALHRLMPQSMVYFFAELDGKIVSTELCLLSSTTIYSFLGGTMEQYFDVRPNNLLKHELIRWARDSGLAYYLIGGGSQLGDGIFEYKSSFAPDGLVDFCIATKIHDADKYAALTRLCNSIEPKSGTASRPWFLPWRFVGAEK